MGLFYFAENMILLFIVLIATGKKLDEFILNKGINMKGIINTSLKWSSREKALVKLAAIFFNNSTWEFKINEIFPCLDEENFKVAIQALYVRF